MHCALVHRCLIDDMPAVVLLELPCDPTLESLISYLAGHRQELAALLVRTELLSAELKPNPETLNVSRGFVDDTLYCGDGNGSFFFDVHFIQPCCTEFFVF